MFLFGAETCVVTPRICRALGRGVHYQMERQLAGRIQWRRLDESWEYTLSEVAREMAGFETTENYIQRRKDTVAHYIVM